MEAFSYSNNGLLIITWRVLEVFEFSEQNYSLK